jgi:hypothetical protein
VVRYEAVPEPDLYSPRGFRYVAYGITLDSDVPLLELKATRDRSPHSSTDKLTVRLGPSSTAVAEPQEWLLQTQMPDGRPWMWAARRDDGYLLRYVGLADFVVSRDGSEIALSNADPVSSRDTLVHLLLDQALPMVLSLRGTPTLHASTVITPNGVCAFLGQAGAGKSTIAASLVMAGCAALGDDCLAIREDGRFYALPAYPGLRLWSDSAESLSLDLGTASAVAHYTSKRRFFSRPATGSLPSRLTPLSVIYCLERAAVDEGQSEPQAPSIAPLSGSNAFLQLLAASFVLDIADRTVLTGIFRFLERLLKAVEVRRLKLPHQFSSLPAVRALIFRDLAAMEPKAVSSGE